MEAKLEERKNTIDLIKKILPFFVILLAAALAGGMFAGKNTEKAASETVALTGSENMDIYNPVTGNDLDTGEEGAEPLTREAAEAETLQGGKYLLSGDYNGTIEIDAHDEIVHLILDNANIRANDGPALYVRSAAKVVLTARDGSENTLSDSGYHSVQDLKAALFAYSDVTINGSGRLNISGFYKDAVHTSGFFKVLDTEIGLKAKRTAIDADDGMLLMPSKMTAEAEKTGLKSGIHNKTDKGCIYILGGENAVIAGNTAILSGKDLYVSGCSLSISAVISDMEVEGVSYIEEGCL